MKIEASELFGVERFGFQGLRVCICRCSIVVVGVGGGGGCLKVEGFRVMLVLEV